MSTKTSAHNPAAGFTLIELMIVVVIIGILAAIAIPRFSNVSRAAKEAEAASILKQVYTLEHRYFQKEDEWADDITLLEGGAALAVGAKYYTFSVTNHATGFCGIATSTDVTVARHQSIDANRVMYLSNNCT